MLTLQACRSPLTITARVYQPGYTMQWHGLSSNAKNFNEAPKTAPVQLTASTDIPLPAPYSKPLPIIDSIIIPVQVKHNSTTKVASDTSVGASHEVKTDSTAAAVSDSANSFPKQRKYRLLSGASIAFGLAGLTSMAIGDAIGLGANGTLSEATTKGFVNGLLFIGLNILGIALAGIAAIFLLIYVWLKKRH